MRVRQYAHGMKIEEAIKAAMARMIERKFQISDVTVESWYEEIIKGYGSGCETCDYGADEDSYEVEISYKHEGSWKHYTHEGSFAELIKELDTD